MYSFMKNIILKFLDLDAYASIDLEIKECYQKMVDGVYHCKVCPHTSVQRVNMVNHVEAKHCPGPGITCYICQKHLVTRQSYRMHLTRNHGVKNCH